MKPVIMWAIYDPDGDMLPETLDYGRANCVDGFLYYVCGTWKKRYRQGYRAVRVKIEPYIRGEG